MHKILPMKLPGLLYHQSHRQDVLYQLQYDALEYPIHLQYAFVQQLAPVLMNKL